MTDIITQSFRKLYRCTCNNGDIDAVPYNISLDPGLYRIELWGASGGGYTGRVGRGGYARAEIKINVTTQYYLFIGSEGFTSTQESAAGGCNGGGSGYQGTQEAENQGRENGGGGGSTDFRIGPSLTDRILVASGGGGTGITYQGGDGGASTGYPGRGWTYDNKTTEGHGGKQSSGGIGGSFTNELGSSFYAENGTLGQGGKGTGNGYSSGGGGGGYYGGGGAYESGAGGGSGYILPSLKGHLKSGRDSFPSPTSNAYETGHIGSGYARITILNGKWPSCKIINYRQYFITLNFVLLLVHHS